MKLSSDHIQQLMQENEYLQVQLEDVNMVLAEREEELQLYKKNAAEASELKSRLDAQLEDLHSLQDKIGDQEQQAMGAEEREFELQQELTAAAKLQNQYNEMVTHYTYIQTQLTDVQQRLEELNTRNSALQKIASKIGELESQLANTVIERDDLITQLKNNLYVQEKDQ